MREQVVVLPPSTDKRKANFHLGKRDEGLLHPNKESSKWAVADIENAEKSRGAMLSSNKDLKYAIDAGSGVTEKMKREGVRDGEEGSIEASKQEAEGERQDNSLPRTAPLLQWGHRKRSRCSRVDNHNQKLCNSNDDSAVLFRKTIRVQADKAMANISPLLASKGNLKAKNGVVAKKEYQYAPPRAENPVHAHQEEKRKQTRHVKDGLTDVRQERKGSPLAGSKRGFPASTHKQDHTKNTCTLQDPKLASRDTCAPPSGGGGEASPLKVELVWPKFVIGLSRKEKEEDFLILKGTKLPQRPRRRPKAVERILHYCSPGSWLVDMSHSRYEVREKKRAKKKPRGLKAMESFESESE